VYLLIVFHDRVGRFLKLYEGSAVANLKWTFDVIRYRKLEAPTACILSAFSKGFLGLNKFIFLFYIKLMFNIQKTFLINIYNIDIEINKLINKNVFIISKFDDRIKSTHANMTPG